jgi:multiple sugar transport system ATP-binding protein
VVQQVGKPQEVYDHPVNTFVAAFLGSPRINLHTGRIEGGEAGHAFVPGDVRIPLPDRLAREASSVAEGSEVAIGVRPEDIGIALNDASPATAETVQLPAGVALVEPVGSDLYVNAATGGISWMARTDPRLAVARGSAVTLTLNLRHAHLFGLDGRNLALAGM